VGSTSSTSMLMECCDVVIFFLRLRVIGGSDILLYVKLHTPFK
jgi:hypothetical protein